MGQLVLTLAGDPITAITRFDNSVLPRFGCPGSCPSDRFDVGSRLTPFYRNSQ
jgi:hypothetical protein